MRKSVFVFFLSVLMAGATFTACQLKEEKVEDAKEDLKEAQQELNSEYPAYKSDMELRITANENRIAELRVKISKPGQPNLDDMRRQRIDDLEKRNAELRAHLYGYEKERSDWE